jgi:hypothetical protein
MNAYFLKIESADVVITVDGDLVLGNAGDALIFGTHEQATEYREIWIDNHCDEVQKNKYADQLTVVESI